MDTGPFGALIWAVEIVVEDRAAECDHERVGSQPPDEEPPPNVR